MTPERWERIAQIYDAVRFHPEHDRPRLLAQICGSDEGLRHEVEVLLEQPVATDSFARFVGGSAPLISEDVTPEPAPSLTGQRLGPYQVQELLGRGGMGEVYRAHDSKLGRDVAIKVLPPMFTADAERLARFNSEARMLAALNHPHIGAIYGFEDAAGVPALVLELVDGDTLADRLRCSAVSPPDALVIARQIAGALEVAHRKGIVHRDLKPANIKITSEGLVKVLDFGLAKGAASEAPSTDASQLRTTSVGTTRFGMVLGTAAYMSPEQACGLRVDTRADIWAFGCVLFEMLTGRPPFIGETVEETFAAIIQREPDWQKLPQSTPEPLRDLLGKCLQKDPEKRLGSVTTARVEIEAILPPPTAADQGLTTSARRAFAPLGRRTAIVVTGVAVAVVASAVFRLTNAESPLPQLINPVQVTGAVGVEDFPTWSPDNRAIAYESNVTGNWDIWVTQPDGGQPVNRTSDYAGADQYPSWSPDGRYIAFWSGRDGGGFYIMPAAGGEPIRVIEASAGAARYSAPAWSPDGARLAMTSYATSGLQGQHSVEIVSIGTRESTRIELPGTETSRLDLSWSPDGRYLAYVEAVQQQSEIAHLRLLRLADRASFIIIKTGANVRHPHWSATGRYLFYVCNCVGSADLWRQRIADGAPVGQPERITTGLEIRDFAFSQDGSRLTYSKGRWVSNFWRVPILEDRPATWTDAEQVTFDQAYVEFLDISGDGRRVTYSSDRTGKQDLYVMSVGGEPLRLTNDPAADWAPAWSPDGRRLAFYSYRTGDREIWVMPAAGGVATQLTRSPGVDYLPQWSPDGHDIAFTSERTGDPELWVISADGKQLRQITHHPAIDGLATWSPDGRWLIFNSTRSGRMQLWRASAGGGEAMLMTRGPGRSPRWSRDGEYIYFSGAAEREGNLWRLSLRDGTEQPITNLVGKRGEVGIMQPATDDRFLYFPWQEDLADIWVMDVKP
jgi:eukaryotic-like serine/threonine-protein kinase